MCRGMRRLSNLTGPTLEPEGGRAPRSAVVLLHGYGANGDDLIGLGQAWRNALPETVFVAPNAPEELPFPAFGGLQWFPLTLRDPGEYRRGVVQAGPALDHFLDQLLEHYSLAADRLALVGFSQGTMMALHVGLRRSTPPAAIVGYSGRLAGPECLPEEITVRPPVLLVHGADDDVVPASAIKEATSALRDVDIDVSWHVQAGLGHGIDNDGLARGEAFLRLHLD